ncbi:hypothetical protein K501DRAFT_98651 [Backusella circina FSU 941]|nr:hypothetical protein K501DRAFT_98651 [Backusella circina FSU 941]
MTEISKSNEPTAHNFTVTQDQTQDKHENTLEKVFKLVNEDYRHDTQFIISLNADDKPPGTLTGEECPASDLTSNSYEYLASQYPHWRRMLSDEYMRNTDLGDISKDNLNPAQLVLLHIDDHAWASIDHYMVASKFIQSPDVYKQFCLDSGDPKSCLTAAEVKNLGLTLPITEDANLDWENRKSDTLRRGLLAKFAQNQDLQRALVLTGWAKLVSQSGNVLELLMWVRAVLRGEQQNNLQQEDSGESSSKQDKVDTDKSMDEVK